MRPASSATARTSFASASPCALRAMSSANSFAESSIPCARWKRVPAAGMSPADSAVDPDGTASRSITTGSMPASLKVSAAISPAAPAPTISTGTSLSNSTSSDERTSLIR